MFAQRCRYSDGLRVSLAGALLVLASAAHALDFRSVGDASAALYDTPSGKAKPLYVVNRSYPFEVVQAKGDWAHVRDITGTMAWIKSAQLVPVHTVIMRSAGEAYVKADGRSPVSAHVAAGVILTWLADEGNWIKVRLPDKREAYIRLNQVWGD